MEGLVDPQGCCVEPALVEIELAIADHLDRRRSRRTTLPRRLLACTRGDLGAFMPRARTSASGLPACWRGIIKDLTVKRDGWCHDIAVMTSVGTAEMLITRRFRAGSHEQQRASFDVVVARKGELYIHPAAEQVG